MKYIVYLTINEKSSVNGMNRVYVGVHPTDDPKVFDGYIGCGVYINQPATYMYPKTPFQHAVKRDGVNAFKRITLYVYDTEADAYAKEKELVDDNFVLQDHTYNAYVSGGYDTRRVYQFNMDGKMVKEWPSLYGVSAFYNLPQDRLIHLINEKQVHLGYTWSFVKDIDIDTYKQTSYKPIHLYTSSGKWLMEFPNYDSCSKYLNISVAEVSDAVAQNKLVNGKYYLAVKMTDSFMPKPRKRYLHETVYVYNLDGTLVARCVGKELMKVIGLHSWKKISNIFQFRQGWYKDFYLSLEPIESLPERSSGILVDVYDKFGNFIETMEGTKAVREKYNVTAAKMKDIEQGAKHCGDYIFKYRRRLSK